MRKMLAASVVAIGVTLERLGRADAWSWGHSGPWPQTAAFPCVNPPGWYTNTYSYAWQYPWFAYYNYSHGPYANWMAGRRLCLLQELRQLRPLRLRPERPVIRHPLRAAEGRSIVETNPLGDEERT